MTAVDVFLDSNIILYAVGATEPLKKSKARLILRTERYGVSAQVLQEVYSVATRKLKPALPPIVAAKWVDRLSKAPFVVTDLALVMQAIANSQRYQISYWDGAIIAAAEALGATTLYSEDLNHGQAYGTVRVVNPFIDA